MDSGGPGVWAEAIRQQMADAPVPGANRTQEEIGRDLNLGCIDQMQGSLPASFTNHFDPAQNPRIGYPPNGMTPGAQQIMNHYRERSGIYQGALNPYEALAQAEREGVPPPVQPEQREKRADGSYIAKDYTPPQLRAVPAPPAPVIPKGLSEAEKARMTEIGTALGLALKAFLSRK